MLAISDIVEATRGKVIQPGTKRSIQKLGIDSRAITAQDGFIAIKGLTHDGHKFIRNVLRRGVKLLIVSKKIKASAGVAVILVKDTTVALGQIANFHRRKFAIPVIGITGSAGKTTTKDLLAHVLSGKFNVLKNNRSENNHIGVPLTLLRLTEKTDIAVVELGTNQPGDICYLTKIVLPTDAVFTNVGESHLEKLKSCRGVFKEKLNLIKGLPAKGSVTYNIDCSHLTDLKRMKSSGCLRSCGIKSKGMFQAKNVTIAKVGQIVFSISGRKFRLRTSVYENVYNALFAISCGRLFGISYNEIKKRLASFNFSSSRQQIIRYKKVWVINDSYNANPVSFRSAVNTLDHLPVDGNKFLVCADMLELGKRSKRLHREAGRNILRTSVDHVFSFGKMSEEINRVVSRSGGSIKAEHFKNINALNRALRSRVKDNDAVLVKGSRGMKMERVVQYLTDGK